MKGESFLLVVRTSEGAGQLIQFCPFQRVTVEQRELIARCPSLRSYRSQNQNLPSLKKTSLALKMALLVTPQMNECRK